ncbi:hypothetical protein [Thermosipho atlanticus]|uniref:Uncharacterized protein n=1 Tax=Thermosipho atlanticus DSM 15807 TaxID=1123380 RepID=A0A1M5R5R8_9BACT|nr:hypothetical protein [Thermosipho atlanticus]SHH21734.1 hypothetical protein SAMN02745199_0357 [Thermosipho atlanticus DSM 15807]
MFFTISSNISLEFVFSHKLEKVGYIISKVKFAKLDWLENILRAIVFIVPVFMNFDVSALNLTKYIILYVIGVTIYFISWLMVIYFSNSYWSKSALGLLAPAYTSIAWLIAIGMLGNLKIYNYLAVLFVIVHTFSTYFKLKIAKLK